MCSLLRFVGPRDISVLIAIPINFMIIAMLIGIVWLMYFRNYELSRCRIALQYYACYLYAIEMYVISFTCTAPFPRCTNRRKLRWMFPCAAGGGGNTCFRSRHVLLWDVLSRWPLTVLAFQTHNLVEAYCMIMEAHWINF